jgi:hypothetical protein
MNAHSSASARSGGHRRPYRLVTAAIKAADFGAIHRILVCGGTEDIIPVVAVVSVPIGIGR